VSARAAAGHPGFAALLVVFMLAFAPRAARAQGEPTPFWIGDPPASETPAPPKKKSKPARPTPPAKHKSSSAFQDDDEAAPLPKHKAAPAPKPSKAIRPKPAPPASVKKRKAAPVEEEEEPLPAPKKKSRYDALPPLPHLEPAPENYPPPTQPAPYQQPYRPPAPQPLPRGSPAPAPRTPRATAPPPYQPPYSPPSPQPFVVPIDERGTATDPSSEKYKQAHPAPTQSYQPRQYQPLRPEVSAPQEPVEEEPATPRLRRFSLEALGGVWSKATSDAKTRDWELAYGLDLGVGFTRWLALDVRAVRSAGTDGNANVNTTTSHLLFDGRLTGAVNLGKFAVFGGAGGGLVLEKTQLFLQDVGSAPTTLSSSGLEGIAEVVIGGRWRPWKGLTMRLEVDVLLRQGALEPVFLLGAGWVF
jgi:hypothetical protein